MFEDGDRALRLIGLLFAGFFLVSIAVFGLTALNVGPDEISAAPDATWSIERVNETHVRIVHAGGPPVAADRLLVSVRGRKRTVSWSADTITEGEGGVVRARRGVVIRLYWIERGSDRELLATWGR